MRGSTVREVSVATAAGNMKFILLSLAVFGCVIADEASYKQQGALLVLPSPYSPYNAQQVQQDEAEPLDKVSERIMERLRQEQGSQNGNYHVYLPDGRLQRVQFTAAPVKAGPSQQVNSQSSASNGFQFNQQSAQSNSKYQQFSQYKQAEQYSSPSQDSNSYSRVSVQGSSGSQVSEPNPVVAHFGRLQQERLQQQLSQLQRQQEQLKQQEEQVQEQLRQQKEFASNFVATVQFSEVPPIPAPIYSQSTGPVTRILRYAPEYF